MSACLCSVLAFVSCLFRAGLSQESETPSLKIQLLGLQAGDSYELEDPLSGTKTQATGGAAMKDRLSFELMQMSSQILLYRVKKAKLRAGRVDLGRLRRSGAAASSLASGSAIGTRVGCAIAL